MGNLTSKMDTNFFNTKNLLQAQAGIDRQELVEPFPHEVRFTASQEFPGGQIVSIIFVVRGEKILICESTTEHLSPKDIHLRWKR